MFEHILPLRLVGFHYGAHLKLVIRTRFQPFFYIRYLLVSVPWIYSVLLLHKQENKKRCFLLLIWFQFEQKRLDFTAMLLFRLSSIAFHSLNRLITLHHFVCLRVRRNYALFYYCCYLCRTICIKFRFMWCKEIEKRGQRCILHIQVQMQSTGLNYKCCSIFLWIEENCGKSILQYLVFAL